MSRAASTPSASVSQGLPVVTETVDWFRERKTVETGGKLMFRLESELLETCIITVCSPAPEMWEMKSQRRLVTCCLKLSVQHTIDNCSYLPTSAPSPSPSPTPGMPPCQQAGTFPDTQTRVRHCAHTGLQVCRHTVRKCNKQYASNIFDPKLYQKYL